MADVMPKKQTPKKPKKIKRLTFLRQSDRVARELERMASEGFTQKDIAKALRVKVKTVSKIKRHSKAEKATAQDAERMTRARKTLEKRHKAELPARKAKSQAKRLDMTPDDFAVYSKLELPDAAKLLKRVKTGKASKSDLSKFNKTAKEYKTKEVYALHDPRFGDCIVFPNKSLAKKEGKAKYPVKGFPDEGQSFEWWKGIAQGAKYFIIVNNDGVFEIWDTRSRQRQAKRKR
jgi:transcriptional regulator with XRE-family HTH domain